MFIIILVVYTQVNTSEAAVQLNLKPEPGFFCPCPHEPHNHIAVVAQDRPTLLECYGTNEIVNLIWPGMKFFDLASLHSYYSYLTT